MKKLSLKEKIILLISFIALLSASIYLVYSENPFQNIIEIKYPDGCIEKYVNGNLTTPNCTYGRGIVESGKKEWPTINYSLKNLSYH